MSDVTIARALMAQIDVNFALSEALLQVIMDANLNSEALEKAMTDVSKSNGELMDIVRGMVSNVFKG